MACNQGKIRHFVIRSLCVSFNALKLDINSQQLRSFNTEKIQAKWICFCRVLKPCDYDQNMAQLGRDAVFASILYSVLRELSAISYSNVSYRFS
jgi:hypothetical protein